MDIREGLLPDMVLQRTAKNVSHAAILGTCGLSGTVEAWITAKGKTVPGFNWRRIGSASKKRFACVLKGLPVGGPYAIALRVCAKSGEKEEAPIVANVLVGDVWVLAGQSNMEGVGWLTHALKPVDAVRGYFMDDTWGVARDPLHNLWCAHAPVHNADPTTSRHDKDRRWAVGPGVSFGQAMYRATGVPQGVIACAHGGTTMEQWDPAKKKLGTNSLYGAMCERVRRNGGRIRGVVWYQGCSDANPDAAKRYSGRMKKLIAAMRRDFRDAALPVVMAQIGRFFFGAGTGEWWNAIQEAQRRLPESIARLAVVPTVDLPLDDGIHLGGDGQNILGGRFAQAMRVLLGDRTAGLPPIELVSVTGDLDIRRFLYTATVTFRHVDGALRSGDEAWGFNHCGTPNKVFRTTLAGQQALLNITATETEMREQGLSYGYGFQPHCTIRDGAGRPLPVFGPVPIDLSRMARWIIITHCEAMILHDDTAIDRLVPPSDWSDARPIVGDRCNSFAGIQAWQALKVPVAGIAYYRCRYEAPSARALTLYAGYDGPVKIWHDGKMTLTDRKGCRPAMPDDKRLPLKVGKGCHEIVVALGARGGRATGLFLTIEDDLRAPKRLRLGETGAH